MEFQRKDPPLALFFTTVLSHLTLIPTIVSLYRRRYTFELVVICFSGITSFLYHTCQSFAVEIFLYELQWHRLDNIGAISSFAVLFAYTCNFANPTTEMVVKLSLVLLSVIIQEKDPWNPAYTVCPIGFLFLLPLIVHVPQRTLFYQMNVKNAVLAFGFIVAAFPCFVAGLDDENDPYRMYHGMWHVLFGLSQYFAWNVVKCPKAITLQGRRCNVCLELNDNLNARSSMV